MLSSVPADGLALRLLALGAGLQALGAGLLTPPRTRMPLGVAAGSGDPRRAWTRAERDHADRRSGMTWILMATGFTGALTLIFLYREAHRRFGTLFSATVRFSPKGGCTEAVVAEIKAARREVLVLAYSFSSKPIADALVEAKKRGVHVEIILDKSNEQETYSDLRFFQENGLAPLIDAHHAIAHNKTMIIDRRTLLTGSFNFTHQAEAENGENLLVIKGHPELVTQYRQDFAAHKAHSQAASEKGAQTPPPQRKAA
jgi:phosphatidylserine/phosphatidylglycerophosphate/cardiolipin synthase-like enzyme